MDPLESLFRTVDLKDQVKVVKSQIDEAVASKSGQKLSAILTRLLRDDVPPQVSSLHFG